MKTPFGAIIILLGSLSGAWATSNQVGASAPAPVLVTFDGQYRYLSKLYYPGEDRPREPRSIVVLNFMSLKCGPCKKELPVLLETMRPLVKKGEETGQPIRFFLISTDPLSSKEDLKKFIVEQGVDPATEVLLDPYQMTAGKFGITNIPRTFVISAQGRIVGDIQGTDEFKKMLVKGVRAALKDK